MPTLLIITQVYPPDPAAVGQHFADVAERMVRRGWRVVVYTSRRGYDDPAERYPWRESRRGVDVRRLPLSSFGKSSILVRLLAQTLFLGQAVIRALCVSRPAALLVSTSPPFAGFGGSLVSRVRRIPMLWWVMDVNPDQMIAAGRISPASLFARVFDWMNLQTLRRSAAVIVLDRFMRDRILAKADVSSKMRVIPPWSHDTVRENIPHDQNPFRSRHGFADRFIVMYSGNHGYGTSFETLLDAAARLAEEPRIRFVFVGGGVGKRQIEEYIAGESSSNVVSLPYQPLNEVRQSLASADVHVVTLASDGVGIVHPCKVYGALAVGRPVIAIAPRNSYIADILDTHRVGWLIEHGDVDGLEALLRSLLEMTVEQREAFGQASRDACRGPFSRDRLLDDVCDLIEAQAAPS